MTSTGGLPRRTARMPLSCAVQACLSKAVEAPVAIQACRSRLWRPAEEVDGVVGTRLDECDCDTGNPDDREEERGGAINREECEEDPNDLVAFSGAILANVGSLNADLKSLWTSLEPA